jgi:hypothetical protein
MVEWHVRDEEVDGAEPPVEEGNDHRSPRNWPLLALLITLLLLGGLGLLRWRVAEQLRLVQADLHEFVTFEEQSRLLGQRVNLPAILDAAAPDAWRAAYRDKFVLPVQRPPTDISLADLWYDEDGALVTVEMDTVREVRYYTLRGRVWRRSAIPVEAWGPHTLSKVSGNITVTYRERDALFARNLLRDLPALETELAAWIDDVPSVAIDITPFEFHPPLISSEEGTLLLNSPMLVPDGKHLDGPAQVRFAVADTLFHSAGSMRLAQDDLPDQARFLDAARAVAAIRWALDPPAQELFRSLWRDRIAEGWSSPFFSRARTRERIDPWNPNRAEASALLAADYLHQTHGPEALASVVRSLGVTRSWDRILNQSLGLIAADLDAVIASYAGHAPSGSTVSQPRPGNRWILLPFKARYAAPHGDDHTLFYVTSPFGAEPILVQAGNARVVLPDGTSLAPECLGFNTALTIDGDWLQAGTPLGATEIAVADLLPPFEPTVREVPEDTTAYLVQRAQSGLNRPRPLALLAIGSDGTASPILDLTLFTQVYPLHQAGGRATRFLLEYNMPACDRLWLFLYEPDKGIVGRWLTDPSLGYWIRQAEWREETNDVLVVLYPRRGLGWRYGILQPSGPTIVQPAGELAWNQRPIGWHEATGRVLLAGTSEPRVRFLEPRTGLLADEPVLNLRLMPVTPPRILAGGHQLLYTTRGPFDESGAITIRARDLRVDRDTLFRVVGGSLNIGETAHPERLPVSTDTLADGSTEGRKLFMVELEEPTRIILAATVPEGDDLLEAFACSDGDLLYLVERGSTRELHRWEAASRSSHTLLATEDRLNILSCF